MPMLLTPQHFTAARSLKAALQRAHKLSPALSSRSLSFVGPRSCESVFGVGVVRVREKVAGGSRRTLAGMAQRKAQVQESQPGKEHLMDPIPRFNRSSYKAAGKLEVRHLRWSLLKGFRGLNALEWDM